MASIIKIKTLPSGAVQSTVETPDGVIMEEFHPPHMSVMDVLRLYKFRQYYVDYGGDWKIILESENGRVFSGKDLVSPIQYALDYFSSKDDDHEIVYFSYP